MAKYDAAAKEKAFEMLMIQAVPHQVVVREMRTEYPTFSSNTLTAWKRDPKLNWVSRYQNYCEAIAEKTDKALVKSIKPMLSTIQDIREKIYNKLITFLDGKDIITDKNIGHVLSSFVKMAELEYKMAGGGNSGAQVKEVVAFVLLVFEQDPILGPQLRQRKQNIEDAVYKMIEGDR